MVGQPSYLGVATDDWVAALKSSGSLERRLAAHALAEIGPAAREAVPALIEALRDPESFVRVWAAAALARVQLENPDAIPALIAAPHCRARWREPRWREASMCSQAMDNPSPARC